MDLGDEIISSIVDVIAGQSGQTLEILKSSDIFRMHTQLLETFPVKRNILIGMPEESLEQIEPVSLKELGIGVFEFSETAHVFGDRLSSGDVLEYSEHKKGIGH